MNVYDVRLVDDYPQCGMNWPPELGDVYTYLRVRPARCSVSSPRPIISTATDHHLFCSHPCPSAA